MADGQELSADYSLTEEDIFAGMRIADRALEGNVKLYKLYGLAMLTAFALLLIFMTDYAIFGGFICILAFWLLLRHWTLPMLRRKKLARELAAKSVSYHLTADRRGLTVSDGSSKKTLTWERSFCAAEKNLLVFIYSRELMIVPLRAFAGGRVPEEIRGSLGENFKEL